MTRLALLLLVACDSSLLVDPAVADARAYQAAMEPILARNAALSRAFTDLAAQIKKSPPKASKVAALVEDRFVPAARKLAEEAEAVDPQTDDLARVHAELEQAWEARAESWEAIHAAWKAADLDAYEAATRRYLAATRAEARYEDEVTALLARRGVRFTIPLSSQAGHAAGASKGSSQGEKAEK